MPKLVVFENLSLDGYYVDQDGKMDWAKPDHDSEFNAFTEENARHGGVLVFGRVTYQMMAAFWPSAEGKQVMPTVAERMNALPKVVFSQTLRKAAWNNTRLIQGDLLQEMKALKAEAGPDLVVLGSGSLVRALAKAQLVDEYQVVI